MAAVAATFLVGAPGPAKADLVEDGLELLVQKTCTGCHTIDGTQRVGPTFLGFYGSTTTVVTNGQRHTLTIDAAYIRRSIETPNADIRVGYPPNSMPVVPFSETEMDALLAAMRYLGSAQGGERSPRAIYLLVLSALVFVFGHILLSSGPMRDPLVARLGGLAAESR